MADEGLEFGVATDGGVAEAARVLALAFGNPAADAEQWLCERAGLENTRVLRQDGVVVTTAIRVPMGIYLGGRSVPQVGIAGVAVAPEARSRGLARRIMRAVVLEMHERGETISTLYSAMHPLYRSIGYETAGQLYAVRVPAGLIESDDRGRGWRPYGPEDEAGVKVCAARRAGFTAGALDRGPYVWGRIFNTKQGPAEAFVAEAEDGSIEAYCVYRLERTPEDDAVGSAAGWTLQATDLGYASGRGLERLLGFMRGFSSVVGVVEFADAPGSALLRRLPDRRYGVALRDSWMLRVVDLRALELRGYPAGFSGSIGLHVADGLVSSNSERVVLEIADRRGVLRAARPDEDTLECGIGDLASLVTGMLGASQLVQAGRLRGPVAQVELADAAFTGVGGPCMFDFF